MPRRIAQAGMLVLLAAWAAPAAAQMSPAEHAKHHPKGGGGDPAQSVTGKDAGMGDGGMMGGMMGSPASKEVFPELMNAPKLDVAGKAKLRAAGDEGVREGTAMISDGLDRLSGAAEVEDWPGMEAALARIREGTARMESGVAARRVAGGELEPATAATDWLKREMNLISPPNTSTARSGPFGLSWFHFVVMVLLVAFAAIMIWMYFHKMRRATLLLQTLSGSARPATATGTSIGTVPAADAKPAAPVTPPAANVEA